MLGAILFFCSTLSQRPPPSGNGSRGVATLGREMDGLG